MSNVKAQSSNENRSNAKVQKLKFEKNQGK
jgi:hypothetical protein